MTLKEIRAVLDSRGLRPLKQFGQNFLHDQNLAKWLAGSVLEGRPPGSCIVEIGPGLGALTEFLLVDEKPLIAIEKDRGLCAFLRERFSGDIAAERLDLREGDALALLPLLGSAPTVICGNLPYYISTPLLMECMRLPGDPARLFFLVQKEVGQRLAAPSGSKVYGALSVFVQAAYDVALVRTLPGSVFYPTPEVESIAVQLTPLTQPLVPSTERDGFMKVVQRGFSQRRKKLSNLLPVADPRRAEHLSPQEWVNLWRQVDAASTT